MFNRHSCLTEYFKTAAAICPLHNIHLHVLPKNITSTTHSDNELINSGIAKERFLQAHYISPPLKGQFPVSAQNHLLSTQALPMSMLGKLYARLSAQMLEKSITIQICASLKHLHTGQPYGMLQAGDMWYEKPPVRKRSQIFISS